MHGANGFRARLRLLLASRAFWALAVYRFGRWVYERPRHPLMLALRALYVLLFEAGRLLTKTSLSVRSRIESGVWIAPRGEVFISLGARVGRDSMLHGGNTLGVGGSPGAGALTRLRFALTLDGSWAMAVYRFGRRLVTIPPHPLAAPLLWALYTIAEVLLGVLTSISIDVEARIEPGFYVGHFVSLRIGPGVRIGKNCSVGQMCTIEGTGRHPATNAPVLGERVYVGSGAKVIGPLRIADGAAICANSVVVEDVPENGVVLGIPGAIISRRGSGDFIYLGAGTGVRDLPANPEPRGALSTG